MKEIWKDIKGYEGQYQVSNLGRVKSLPRTTPYINKAGYESCQFREGQLKKEIGLQKHFGILHQNTESIHGYRAQQVEHTI